MKLVSTICLLVVAALPTDALQPVDGGYNRPAIVQFLFDLVDSHNAQAAPRLRGIKNVLEEVQVDLDIETKSKQAPRVSVSTDRDVVSLT